MRGEVSQSCQEEASSSMTLGGSKGLSRSLALPEITAALCFLSIFLKYYHVDVCVCVIERHVCGCPWRLEVLAPLKL